MSSLPIKDFSKSKIRLNLPYLIDVQKASWIEFWARDFKELLEEMSPIRDYTGKWLELWLLDYELGEPNYANEFEAKRNEDSFAASLRITVKLKNLKTNEESIQDVFFGDFPLMTDRGTFIINGVERVVISQLLRSPGAFFTIRRLKGNKLFGARMIPSRGSWLEFETDISKFIGIKIDRRRRVPATTLLRAFGIDTDEKIRAQFSDLKAGSEYIEETLKRDTTNNQAEALVEIYRRLRPGDLASPDTAKELIDNMFFNFERYDLSKVGRWKTLQRLPELAKGGLSHNSKSLDIDSHKDKITTEDRVLRVEDIIAILREIIRLNITPGSEQDEIDHLGNRRVRTISELLKDRLRVGLMRVERVCKDRMSTLDSSELAPARIINPRPFMAGLNRFFASSQLSQFMDNENILAELEHKRRLTCGGPGGLTRKRAGLQVRDVQPSHYGRICPIQTPEGPNVGLVGHLAMYARVNPYGFIETPYFKVDKGRVTNKVEYLNAFQEEDYIIANACIDTDDKGVILDKEVEVREKGKPRMVKKNDIDYIDVAPEQFISTATGLIPFLKNDDANRALMGSNMQRQSVPLIRPEVPLVSTGLEERVVKDSGKAVIAIEDGKIVGVDAMEITIQTENSKLKNNERVYKLRNFDATNQYTYFHHTPIVRKGDLVKAGDIIADPTAANNGSLALGQNLLIAFLPWRGHNYEDAIIISERLLEEEYLTSIHIETFACDVRETKLGPEVTTSDIPNVSEEKLKDIDAEGIIRIGAEVGPSDILVGKISPKGEIGLTAEERLLWAIFGEKAKNVKDTSLLMEHGKRGRVIRVKEFSRDAGHKLKPGVIKRYQVEVAQIRKVTVGDKIAGRHGNKGIVAKILPKEEMPFMKDGTPVDVILNPLGVISRMNLGQVLEAHLGWAAKTLNYRAVTPSLSGAKEEDIKEELKKAGLPEAGKIVLYDGKTGEPFLEKVTVGYMYIMRLIHMVGDKIHMRSIGPYSLITQQPLGGRAQFGGQRFGEMEVWALEGYGAAYSLQEMLTIKSDDVAGRAATYQSILKGRKIQGPNIPASFSLLVNELKALGLNVELKGK
ncbi:DNA-directed RNA polymerase subunit beta [Patescibacteria group bacterium]|nr:DNA-directed RNA polymerase subunit beta [Patescibacteria group bacterium]MBU4022972.1 DNA-directed RNA polymerase subunit beta [Patescibacteria group bacterium]MBU4078544.1 DNA-directed RNA polymerase subunit beta [Patescibacteria group bacterium]